MSLEGSSILQTHLYFNWVFTRSSTLPLKQVEFGAESLRTFEPSIVERYFKNDAIRSKKFLELMACGQIGKVFIHEEKWVAYGWLKPLGALGPDHLPFSELRRRESWIHWCRTASEYQGKGFYKKILTVLAEHAFEKNSANAVFLDTEVNNKPAIAAIKSSGFRRCGILFGFRQQRLKRPPFLNLFTIPIK